MRNRFEKQLELLNLNITKIGSLCEEIISCAAKSLLAGDKRLIERVFEIDSEIDEMQKEIESICMKVLLQQQPVARDLRTISSALKINSDFKRIGDHATDIAEILKFIDSENISTKLHIEDMAAATIKMVTKSVQSFVEKDILLAQEVISSDDEVDALFIKIKSELTESIKNDTKSGEVCLDLLMIAKYFERIGDHAEKIAYWVYYYLTGERK